MLEYMKFWFAQILTEFITGVSVLLIVLFILFVLIAIGKLK